VRSPAKVCEVVDGNVPNRKAILLLLNRNVLWYTAVFLYSAFNLILVAKLGIIGLIVKQRCLFATYFSHLHAVPLVRIIVRALLSLGRHVLALNARVTVTNNYNHRSLLLSSASRKMYWFAGNVRPEANEFGRSCLGNFARGILNKLEVEVHSLQQGILVSLRARLNFLDCRISHLIVWWPLRCVLRLSLTAGLRADIPCVGLERRCSFHAVCGLVETRLVHLVTCLLNFINLVVRQPHVCSCWVIVRNVLFCWLSRSISYMDLLNLLLLRTLWSGNAGFWQLQSKLVDLCFVLLHLYLEWRIDSCLSYRRWICTHHFTCVGVVAIGETIMEVEAVHKGLMGS